MSFKTSAFKESIEAIRDGAWMERGASALDRGSVGSSAHANKTAVTKGGLECILMNRAAPKSEGHRTWDGSIGQVA